MTRARIFGLTVAVVLAASLVAVVAEEAAAAFFVTVEDQRITHAAPKAKDQFGAERAAAMSGDTLIVGVPGDDLNGVHPDNFGSASVFRKVGATWSLEAELTAADAAVNDQFGVSVDIEGNTAVVGMFADGSSDWGAAYIYQRTGTSWSQVRKLTVNGLPANARLGWDVAISGNYIAVAAIGAATVYVFLRDGVGAGGWSNVPVAVLPGGGGAFGENIAMSGDILAIGARAVNKVFLYDAGINFAQVKVITGPAAAFAYSLDIDGNTLAVGVPGASTGTINAHGAVYVYDRNQGGANVWGLNKIVKPASVATGGGTSLQMGTGVAISGTLLVAGALSNDAFGTNAGAAYAFERNNGGANAWGQLDRLFASNAAAWKYFGASVAAVAPTVFVGSPGYIPKNPGLTGEGYLFYNVGGTGGGDPPPPPPPPGDEPAAPSNLVPTVQSATSIKLTWDDNSNNETNFEMQRAPQGGTYALIANPGQNQTAYIDNGLTAGSWCYRIRAKNSSGVSPFVNSTPACISVGGGSTGLPAAPSNLVPTVVSPSRIDLTWNDNSNNETHFQLQRAPQGGAYSQLANPGMNQVKYIDSSVTSGSWCYRIRSRNGEGSSSFVVSNPTCISTGGGSSGPPAAPSNLVPTVVSSSRIDLTWNDNSNNETHFQLQRAPQGGIYTDLANPGMNQVKYIDSAATAGSWCYRIRARNNDGSSSFVFSVPACIDNSAGGPPPAAPSNLTAAPLTSTSIDLRWDDNSSNETNFQMQRAPQGGIWSNLSFPGEDQVRYIDTGVATGSWCYRIRSSNANGDSSFVNSTPICLVFGGNDD